MRWRRRRSAPTLTALAVLLALPLPDVDGALAEIDYALGTLGLDGVLLLTNANGVYLGDSRLDAVFGDSITAGRWRSFIHGCPPVWSAHPFDMHPSSSFVSDTTRAVTHLILTDAGTLPRSAADCAARRRNPPVPGRPASSCLRPLCQRRDGCPCWHQAYLRQLLHAGHLDEPAPVASVLQLVGPEHILFRQR